MNSNQPSIILQVENPNYPKFAETLVTELAKEVGKITGWIEKGTSDTQTILGNQYKEIIYNLTKLEVMKLKTKEAEQIVYGTGSSHVWISYRENINAVPKRFAIVKLENF